MILSQVPASFAFVAARHSSITGHLSSADVIIDDLRAAIVQMDQQGATTAPGGGGIVLNTSRQTQTFTTRTPVLGPDGLPKNPCPRCQKRGHTKHQCPNQRATRIGQANVATEVGTDGRMVALTSTGSTRDGWLFDPGATVHVCRDESAFTSMELGPSAPVGGVGGAIATLGRGTVAFARRDNSMFSISNVLYCPDAPANIISGVHFQDNGYDIHYPAKGVATVSKDNVNIFDLRREPGCISRLDAMPAGQPTPIVLTAAPLTLWHNCLCHLNYDALRKLARSKSVVGLDVTTKGGNPGFCNDCAAGKAHRATYPASDSRSQRALELVHSDLLDFPERTASGYRYLCTFVDDFSLKLWTYPLRSKADVHDVFVAFKARVENETELHIARLRSDNGLEYVNSRMSATLAESGIVHEPSAPYTPQQNGRAERINRSIVEAVLTMLHQSGLPKSMWAEAVACYTQVKNASPHSGVNGVPDLLYYGRAPDVSALRPFGCRAWVTVPAARRRKLDDKGIPTIFIGYERSCKAWRLWDPESNRLIVSRDVNFDESHFPLATTNAQAANNAINERVITGGVVTGDSSVQTAETPTMPAHDEPARVIAAAVDEPATPEQRPAPPVPTTPVAASRFHELHDGDVSVPDFMLPEPESPDPLALVAVQAAVDSSMSDVMGFELPSTDPRNWRDVSSSPDADAWAAAADDEYESLQSEYGVFTVVDPATLPPNASIVGSTFVFKTKRDERGRATKCKARLVAQGFSQRPGLDYSETFAPVVRFSSIRLLTAIAAVRGYAMIQADVDKAYLHGKLDEELYMRGPVGYPGTKGKVLRLHKSLYGLKQAGRTWNERLNSSLIAMGYTRSKSDHCVYYMHNNDISHFVAVYVDDLLFVGPDRDLIGRHLDTLETEYGIKRLGDANFILGIQVIRRSDGTIALSQRQYLEDVLTRFGMRDAKPASTPLVPNTVLEPGLVKPDEATSRRYRQLIGSLTYAMTGTRPDLAFAVGYLGRFSEKPTSEHWAAGMHVLRYIAGTLDYGLAYGQPGSDLVLRGYSDSTWISCPETSRSTNGYVITLGGCAIAWQSHRQSRIASSSTDAEYLGLTDCSKTIIGVRDLLGELGLTQNGPTTLYGDNTGANALARNPAAHQRTRHVRLTEHLVREHVAAGHVSIQYLPTDDMCADTLTKPLPAPAFIKFRAQLGVVKVN